MDLNFSMIGAYLSHLHNKYLVTLTEAAEGPCKTKGKKKGGNGECCTMCCH